MKNFKNKPKAEMLSHIVYYLVEEDFPYPHLEAIYGLVTLFNWSDKSEREIFDFVEDLKTKYFRR